MFGALQAAVQSALERPFSYAWTVQGMGMLRTYFGKDQRYRLNIWDSALHNGASMVHDHPWDLKSWVIAGRLANTRFRCDELGAPFNWMVIKTGEGCKKIGDSGIERLSRNRVEYYRPGETYSQYTTEIHETGYLDGTVTLNDRTNRNGENARVFWRHGTKWVSAEPRPATYIEINNTTLRALGRF